MGDAGLSADSYALNFKAEAFHDNYLRNILDQQDTDGSIPDVVPMVRYTHLCHILVVTKAQLWRPAC